MKLFIKLSVVTLLSLFVLQPVSGQKLLKNISKKIKEKTEQKVEDKVEDKVKDETNKKIDDALESDEQESNQSSNDAALKLLNKFGISSEPVPYETSYSFDQLIQMQIETYDKSGKKIDEGEFITHFDSNSKSMAYQFVSGDMVSDGQGMFIIDSKNGAVIMLNAEEGEKKGIVYGMNSLFESLGQTYNEENDLAATPETYLANPNISKTGKTKTIAGYKCEEYEHNDEYSESNYWITKDIAMDTQDYMSTLFKTSVASNGMGWGYMMEATSVDKQSGEKSIMKVTDVDQHSKVKFSLDEYQISNLGSITIPNE